MLEIDRLTNLVWAHSPQGTKVRWYWDSSETKPLNLYWSIGFVEESLRLNYTFMSNELLNIDFEECAASIASANDITEQIASYLITNAELSQHFGHIDTKANCSIKPDKSIVVVFQSEIGDIPILIPTSVIDIINPFLGNDRMAIVGNEAWNIISGIYNQQTGSNPVPDDDCFCAGDESTL